MRRITSTVTAACAALALTAGAASAQSIPANRLTYVTFSAPVSIPGMTLPAGNYQFKLADSNANRHIVQIFNADGTKLFTTLLAVPATRMKPTGDSVITFKETPSDRPPAVHYWYYAGDLAGNELVYPRRQAQMIANASHEPVMAVDSDSSSADDLKKGTISKVSPDQTPATSAPTPASTPAAPPTATMDRSPERTDTNASPAADSDRTLPRTASNLPLVGLIGLLALAGAVALRAVRAA
jgi:hypothetical protein